MVDYGLNVSIDLSKVMDVSQYFRLNVTPLNIKVCVFCQGWVKRMEDNLRSTLHCDDKAKVGVYFRSVCQNANISYQS